MKKIRYGSECADGESCNCHFLDGGLCDTCQEIGCRGVND